MTDAATTAERVDARGIDASPPQPLVDADSAGFWAATARGEFAVCRCQECRRWIHPPIERCVKCAGPTAFEAVSGRGTIHSFIVANRPSVPGFGHLVPYVVAVVELAEQPGLRVVSRITGIDPGDVAIGQPVRAEVVDLRGGSFRIAEFHVVEP